MYQNLTALKKFTGPVSRFIKRHTCRPPVGRVTWGDLEQIEPISKSWGFDRGVPVDRYYMERFLSKYSRDVRGRVLEIGDNEYTRRYGGKRVAKSDILHVVEGNPKATLTANLASAPQLPSETFDCIICTQTLQLIYDVPSAVATLYRLLSPGGVLLATVPGISRIVHGDGVLGDYWRFTLASATRLFEACHGAEVQVQARGNVLSAVAFLHGLATEDVRVDDLEADDPDYQVLITVRVTKAARIDHVRT